MDLRVFDLLNKRTPRTLGTWFTPAISTCKIIYWLLWQGRGCLPCQRTITADAPSKRLLLLLLNTDAVKIIPLQQMDTSWLGSLCESMPAPQLLNDVSVLVQSTLFRHSVPVPPPYVPGPIYSPGLSQRQNAFAKDHSNYKTHVKLYDVF